MFCGECGTQNQDTNSFCKNCGKPLRRPQQAVAPVQPAQPTHHIPPAVTPSPQPSAAVVQPQRAVAVRPVRNWAGIASLIIAILSWILYPIILGFFAILAGIFTVYAARKAGSGIPVTAVIGIIAGLLAIVLNFFWLDIFPPPQTLPPI